MVPFEKAKRILNSNGKKHTDEEIRKIIEYLAHLAKINVEFILKKMEKEDPSISYILDRYYRDEKI